MSDYWSKGRDAFFDVSFFYPIAPSYRQKELKAIYKQHEGEKKRSYSERVCEVERALFTPLVFRQWEEWQENALFSSRG